MLTLCNILCDCGLNLTVPPSCQRHDILITPHSQCGVSDARRGRRVEDTQQQTTTYRITETFPSYSPVLTFKKRNLFFPLDKPGFLLYFGASFKDLGKKLFCFSLMESGAVVAAVRGDGGVRRCRRKPAKHNEPTPVQEFANAGAGIRQRRCRNSPTPVREFANAGAGICQRRCGNGPTPVQA